jgi:WbqC-like protein family
MQPYFFPYIGYWQLVAAVDLFIVYDNIKYTKKGWINRNRILRNGEALTFTLPLKKDSDFLDIRNRTLASEFDRRKLLNSIRGAYEIAPFFGQTFQLVADIINCDETNLFRFLRRSIEMTCGHLGITTPIAVSSEIDADHSLASQERVIALCQAVRASTYVNPIGGTELYSDEEFARNGIALRFLRSAPITYKQFDAPYVPWLSIIDVMMFNPLETIERWVKDRSYSALLKSSEVPSIP